MRDGTALLNLLLVGCLGAGGWGGAAIGLFLILIIKKYYNVLFKIFGYFG